MKPVFHIITPFSRPHNIPALAAMFQNMGSLVTWHPVCHDVSHADSLWDAGADTVLMHRHIEGWDLCYEKLNAALDYFSFPDEDYVGFLCDDDLYEPGVITELSRNVGLQVLVISAKRWHRGKVPRFDGCVLEASRGNARPCHIGVEQLFVRADVMREYRFNNSRYADGELAERLLADGRSFFCCPDLFVGWNCLPDVP